MASKSGLCRQDCVAGGSMAGSVMPGGGGRRGTDTSRVSSVSSQFSDGPQHSPSSTHSSTPSWSEEPAQSNMDISTGHMILVSGPFFCCIKAIFQKFQQSSNSRKMLCHRVQFSYNLTQRYFRELHLFLCVKVTGQKVTTKLLKDCWKRILKG